MKLGFTLIELLIVIAIIGILSAILFLTIGGAPLRQARDTKRVADANQVVAALNRYLIDNDHLPCTGFQQSDNPAFISALVSGGYLPQGPKDPLEQGKNHYQYSSYKDVADGPCGQVAIFGYNIEVGTQCPSGVRGEYVTHCHILIPHGINCSDPFRQQSSSPADCTALRD